MVQAGGRGEGLLGRAGPWRTEAPGHPALPLPGGGFLPVRSSVVTDTHDDLVLFCY